MSNPNQLLNACEVEELANRVIREAGNGLCALLASTGCKLGLYRSLADASAHSGPLTASELAARCGLVEQYVRDWLASQVAAGYVSLERSRAGDEDTVAPRRFYLNEAQEAVFARENHPQCTVPRLLLCTAVASNVVHRLEDEFREGRGIHWKDNHPDNFVGHDLIRKKEFREHVLGPLVRALPDELAKRLEVEDNGPPVLLLDMACGTEYAVNELANRWPSKLFALGIDTNEPFVVASLAEESHPPNALFVKGNTRSVPLPHEIPELVCKWQSFSPQHKLPAHFDVVLIIITLHHFADPVTALRAIRRALHPSNGVLVVFEPGSQEPRLETLGSAATDAYLAASAAALCGPCALADRIVQSECSDVQQQTVGLLSSDEQYFSSARDAGFTNIKKFTDRIFVFSG